MTLHLTTGRSKRYQEYEDPKTFGEAERRLIALDLAIREIEAQLGDPNLRDKKGSHKQYKSWRTSALKVKAYKVAESRNIRLWIKE